MIRWPARYSPERAPIHVRNEIEVAAPLEIVWAHSIRAVDWPSWYPNSRDVRIDGGSPELSAGVHFAWSTFGVSLVTTVEEFEPPSRIAWLARGLGVEAYHAWLLAARRRHSGCERSGLSFDDYRFPLRIRKSSGTT